MSFKTKILLVFVFILPLGGLLYKQKVVPSLNLPPLSKPAEVTLEFWGLWDNSDSWEAIIQKFEAEKHVWNGQEVKVKIHYSKKEVGTFREELAKTFEKNQSPSLFIVNNYWTQNYAAYATPLPSDPESVQQYKLLDPSDLKQIFPEGVLKTARNQNGQLIAMPLYSDSLALYYNKKLFKEAGIEKPPATWDDVKATAHQLTIVKGESQIVQSGIALGNGKNVSRAADIYALLVLQGHGKIVDQDGKPDFQQKILIKTTQGDVEKEPGITALKFYTAFSDPDYPDTYSWNDTPDESIKTFAAGKVAMILGYSYQKENILALNADLDYGVAPVPQLTPENPINFYNAWLPMVSNQKTCAVQNAPDNESIDCAKIAWSFLSFALQKENLPLYLDKTQKAAARQDLAAEQAQTVSARAVFAEQNATARGYNKFNDQIDEILVEMLDKLAQDRSKLQFFADEAADKIQALPKN